MKRGLIIPLVGILAFFITACEVPKQKGEAGGKKEAQVQVISVEDALAQLPCFKCHKLDSFKSASVVKGEFPHKKHMAFDVHCNQCHQVQGHEKPVIFKETCNACHNISNFTLPANGLPVNFTHKQHARRFSCSECHPALFEMKRGTNGITMEKIYAGKLCGQCHDGKKAFASSECTKCHDMKGFKKDVKYPGGGMQPVVFSHEFHTAMFGCTDCHEKFFKMKARPGKMTMAEMGQGKYCGGCHNGQVAFSANDCAKCHK